MKEKIYHPKKGTDDYNSIIEKMRTLQSERPKKKKAKPKKQRNPKSLLP
jgi:hypothetical protein